MLYINHFSYFCAFLKIIYLAEYYYFQFKKVDFNDLKNRYISSAELFVFSKRLCLTETYQSITYIQLFNQLNMIVNSRKC